MNGPARVVGLGAARSWLGWCCPYCAGPLEERAHGLACPAEERWFATDAGIHRLLTEDRRREDDLDARMLGEWLHRPGAIEDDDDLRVGLGVPQDVVDGVLQERFVPRRDDDT